MLTPEQLQKFHLLVCKKKKKICKKKKKKSGSWDLLLLILNHNLLASNVNGLPYAAPLARTFLITLSLSHYFHITEKMLICF